MGGTESPALKAGDKRAWPDTPTVLHLNLYFLQYKSRRKVKVFIPDYIFLMEIQLYSNYFLNKKSKLDITFLEPPGTINSIKYNIKY